MIVGQLSKFEKDWSSTSLVSNGSSFGLRCIIFDGLGLERIHPKDETQRFPLHLEGKLPVNHRQRGCLLATVVRGPAGDLLVTCLPDRSWDFMAESVWTEILHEAHIGPYFWKVQSQSGLENLPLNQPHFLRVFHVSFYVFLSFSVNFRTNTMWSPAVLSSDTISWRPSEARPDGSNGHRCRQQLGPDPDVWLEKRRWWFSHIARLLNSFWMSTIKFHLEIV